MTKEQFNEYGKPIAVLGAICVVTSLLLAATNSLTAPVIEANERKIAQAAYYEVLPAADTFETVAENPNPDVLEIVKDSAGNGYVIKSQGQGYGGKVPTIVAFDASGKIAGVKFLENSETKGFGSRLYEEPSWSEQFAGMEAQNFTLSDIDALSGATLSSKAAVQAINAAIDAYNQVEKGGS